MVKDAKEMRDIAQGESRSSTISDLSGRIRPGDVPMELLPRGRLSRSRSNSGQRIWGDPLRLTLFALVLMSISRLHQHFGFLSVFRPALLLAMGAFAIAVLKPGLLSRLPWSREFPARAIAGLGAVSCLSAVFGMSLGGAALFFLEYYSKVLILAFLVMATIRSARDLYRYIWAYVLACTVLVWDALVLFKTSRAIGDLEFYRLWNLYTYDANDLGVVLLVGLPLALCTFQLSGRAGKVLSLAVILGIGAAIAKTGSRGAFLGFAAFCLATVFLVDSVQLWKRLGFVSAILVALVFASPTGYWDQMKTILSPTSDYNWDAEYGRRNLTKRGLGYMAQYPVFGVGIGNFARAEGSLSERARQWRPGDPAVRWMAPHSSFLQVATEMGTVGFTLWVGLVFGSVLSLWRLRLRIPRRWRRGTFDQRVIYHSTRYVAVAMVTFAVSGAFVSHAYTDHLHLLGAMAVGLLALVRAAGKLHPSRSTIRQWRGLSSPPAQDLAVS